MAESETKSADVDTSWVTEFQEPAAPERNRPTGNPELDDVGEEYLAEAVVRLIRGNRRVQKAILDFAVSSSNIKTEI